MSIQRLTSRALLGSRRGWLLFVQRCCDSSRWVWTNRINEIWIVGAQVHWGEMSTPLDNFFFMVTNFLFHCPKPSQPRQSKKKNITHPHHPPNTQKSLASTCLFPLHHSHKNPQSNSDIPNSPPSASAATSPAHVNRGAKTDPSLDRRL